MALPTPTKTWIFKTFTVTTTGTAVTDFKNWWLAFVKAMTTSNGWTNQAGGAATNSYLWNLLASGNGTVALTIDTLTTLLGTNTSSNVNTSGNNVLRIRNNPLASYSVCTVTSGASVAKTTIASDLNTAFTSAGLTTLVATVTGTSQILISDTSSANNGYIDVDSVGNGSTLNAATILGFNTSGGTTRDNITYAAATGSWFILGQPQINPNFQILMGLSNSNYYQMSSYVSHYAGFTLTGLSPTAWPSASDRIQHHPLTGSLNGISTQAWGCTFYIMMSTDGQCTRIFGFHDQWNNFTNSLRTFWLFDKPKNPISAWTNPSVCLMTHNAGQNPCAFSEVCSIAQVSAKAPTIGAMNLFFTTEFYLSAALGANQQTPNQLSGEWPMTPIGLVSATAGANGRHGELYDLWFTSNYLYPGVSFPSTTTRDFMVFSPIVHPWNQSALVTA